MKEDRWIWLVVSVLIVGMAVAIGLGVAALFLPEASPVQMAPVVVEPGAPIVVEPGVEPRSVERNALLCATESGNCVESWNGSDIVVYSDARTTQKFAVDGATGDTTLDGVLSTDETDNTSVGAQTLVPVATFYQFAPVSVLTLTISTTGALDGDWLILQNTVATNTEIVDTGATVGGSVIDLGLNDLAIFIYGNGKWIEVASPDNS